jgi:Acetyltransferase (GNAT) domain
MPARLLEQIVARPVDSFRLSAGGAQVYKHAADVAPAIWGTAFGDSHKDFEYHRLIEQTMLVGLSYLYLLVFDELYDPVALQPLIVIDQDLLVTAAATIKTVVNFVRKFWPRFLRARMLLAGCLDGDSKPGVIAPASPRRVHGLLAEALCVCARRQKISLVATKDFPAAMREELSPFVRAGYTRVGGFPPLMLDLNFASFDQYMDVHLSRVTRKSLRRKLRWADAISPPIAFEVLTDCREVIDELYPLYLSVAKRAPLAFETFSREYFLEAGKRMPGRHRYFVWRRNGKAIAFNFCTIWNGEIWDNEIGFDYAVAHELNLYYRTFRDVVVWALHNGVRHYYCGPFNFDPKLHLRLRPVPVDLYVWHRSSIINALIRRIAPLFAPAKSDPALRKYFRVHNGA